MFIELDKIKYLEVELSTYCNAYCPGCSRHYWGTSNKLPNLVEEHLDVDTVTNVIKQIPNIKELEIELCGNFVMLWISSTVNHRGLFSHSLKTDRTTSNCFFNRGLSFSSTWYPSNWS